MSDSEALTLLLQRAARGERSAWDRIAPQVYDELERVAAAKMRRRFGRQMAALTIEPAELVQETMLRLFKGTAEFENRRHFYAYASKVLIGALADYERRRRADKRGGDALRVSLAAIDRESGDSSFGILSDLLEMLEQMDERKAEVVKLRLLWGMQNSEIAATLEISLATVERDWKFSRSWLRSRLRPQSGSRSAPS